MIGTINDVPEYIIAYKIFLAKKESILAMLMHAF